MLQPLRSAVWALMCAGALAIGAFLAGARVGDRCTAYPAAGSYPCAGVVSRDVTELGDKLGELLTDPAAVKGADLQAGLSRATCRVTLSPVPAAGPAGLPALYERACPSVYIVAKPRKCDNCPHTHFESATAFAISVDGVLVTNYHVVAGDYPTMAVVDSAGGIHRVFEVLAGSKDDDLALLRIEGPTIPLPVREGAPVGTRVAVIGHPGMRFFTLTDGIISRYWTDGAAATPSMAITAEYAVGSSGSPVLDEGGDVVAIGAATIPITADNEGKVLQMVVKRCVPAASLVRMTRG